MKFLNIYLSMILGVWTLNASAQTETESSVSATSNYQISGQLLERGTQKILDDVNLYILPLKNKATTDKNGKFIFSAVPAGDYKLVINLSGYKKMNLDISVTEDSSENIIYLERESYNGLETVVTGKKEKRDGSQKTLGRSDFLQMPGSGGDPVKAVQNLPGVNYGGASAQIIIQGSDPSDTGYVIDGHPVPLIFHFGGLSSVVVPEAVESVNYLSAGFGPEYGRQVGGYVGLDLKSPQKKPKSGYVFFDIFNAGGMIESEIDSSSRFLIGGRYSYIGYALKAATDNMPEDKKKDFSLTVAPVFGDFTAMYEKDLSDTDQFKVSFVEAFDEVQFVLSKPIRDDPALRGNFYQRRDFYRFMPQFKRRWSEDEEFKISTALGQDHINFDIGTNYFDLKSNNMSLRGEYQKRYSALWKSYVGIDNDYAWFNLGLRVPNVYSAGGVSNPIGASEVISKNLSGADHTVGVYTRQELKWNENSSWSVIPGVRADRFARIKETVLDPRLAFRYAPSEGPQYRAAWGIYHQAPEAQATDEDFGNPKIKSIKAEHWTVGGHYDLRQGSSLGWDLDGNLFYKKLSQLVVSDTTTKYSNQGSGQVHGFELQAKYFWETWNATLSYTLSRSRRNQPNQPEYPSQYDQTHNVNLLTSYRRRNITIGTRLRYISGSPRTPIVGASYDSDNDLYIPQRGEYFSSRKDGFFQLDVRLDYKRIYDTWIWSYYLDIQNLTNTKNEESLQYSYDYQTSQKVSGLPILPTFGVKGEF